MCFGWNSFCAYIPVVINGSIFMKAIGKYSIIVYGIIILVAMGMFYTWFKPQENKVVVNHDVVLEKMGTLGKLELTKFTVKDVIEKDIVKPYWVDWFDEKVLFIAVGEIAGCIDLTKVTRNDIVIGETLITIRLPEPEICYAKLDHSRSKVYNISGDYFKAHTQENIEDVYRLAEGKLEVSAKELGIVEQTRKNSRLVVKPLFENLSGKKVKLIFDSEKEN